MSDYEFLDIQDVIKIHQLQIEKFGGLAGIRDYRLLDSAVNMPKATLDGELLHTDKFLLAAAYAFHISQNQPFFDGNKRTALATALVFLDINGINIIKKNEILYNSMMAVSTGKMNKSEFAEILKILYSEC